MNEKRPIAMRHIEPLVRSYLEHEADSVDVERNLAAILDRVALDGQAGAAAMTAPTDSESLHTANRRAWWRPAPAACVLCALGLGWYFATFEERASAYAIVDAARAALAQPADRCYRIESSVPKGWLRKNPFLRVDSQTLLWTRGDRFRVVTTTDEQEFIWGQDEKRNLWLTCSPSRGLSYDGHEVPAMFARTRVYLGLNVGKLARRFLDRYELRMEDSDGDPTVAVIHATAREVDYAMPFDSARLEVDRKTKVIRRMDLSRTTAGARGTFTFILVDQASQPDDSYRLKGNLELGAEIFSKNQSSKRAQILDDLTEERRRQ